ncbi:MAG: AhpD family alkylhydroperoxidase [Candidatus Azotimanducaceae bacterium]|jgi:AhpD family alkylhydroperoxidase
MTKEILQQLTYPEHLDIISGDMKERSKLQPFVMQGFSTLHNASATVGLLDAKTKELIALAIAVAAQCDGYIAFHTHDAMVAGASREEIMDAMGVAILMVGGPPVILPTYPIEASVNANKRY